MSYDFDICVIGSGPGGYVCAIRAAQLGKQVAIIEKRPGDKRKGPRLGGTCLNIGCIPSKALLDSSEHYYNAVHHFPEHGIEISKAKINIEQMMNRKDKVVGDLTDGIAYLMKKNKITVHAGLGKLLDEHRISIDNEGDVSEISARNIVLATGSVPVELPFLPFDGERIISSDQAIALEKIPKCLVVVGGGVIGLELGSVWSRLGSEVHIVEFLSDIAGSFDKDISRQLQKVLTKQGIQFHMDCKVTGAEKRLHQMQVSAEEKNGEELSLSADKILVCVGRKPLTDNTGIEELGLKLTDTGRVQVNQQFQTSAPNIYAIGDLIEGPMLAHKAEEDGVAVAEILGGEHGHVDYNLIPGVIYTWPELAQVGTGEDTAREQGRRINIGTFSYTGNGRAKAAGDTDGMVKVIADAETDQVLGVSILGPRASDIIAECVAVMEYSGCAEDIARICHAHPTFSEAVKEAALDAIGRVIHA